MFYNDKTHTYENKQVKDWHKWFAWKPVSVNGEVAWFKFIYRRGVKLDRTYKLGGNKHHGWLTISHERKWQWDYATDLFDLLQKSDEPFPLNDDTLTTYSARRPSHPPPPGVPQPKPRTLKF